MEMCYLACMYCFGFIALVSAGPKGPEHTIVDGFCNPMSPKANMTMHSSDMTSSWVSDLLVWRCLFYKWISAYHAICFSGDNETISLPCPEQNVFDCACGNQTCQIDDFGCEICLCEGGKFRNPSMVSMYHRTQQMIYRSVMEKYQDCQQTKYECQTKSGNATDEGEEEL